MAVAVDLGLKATNNKTKKTVNYGVYNTAVNDMNCLLHCTCNSFLQQFSSIFESTEHVHMI